MSEAPVRYDEMEQNKTTARILHRMTDPEDIQKRKLVKEEKEMNELQANRIGL